MNNHKLGGQSLEKRMTLIYFYLATFCILVSGCVSSGHRRIFALFGWNFVTRWQIQVAQLKLIALPSQNWTFFNQESDRKVWYNVCLTQRRVASRKNRRRCCWINSVAHQVHHPVLKVTNQIPVRIPLAPHENNNTLAFCCFQKLAFRGRLPLTAEAEHSPVNKSECMLNKQRMLSKAASRKLPFCRRGSKKCKEVCKIYSRLKCALLFRGNKSSWYRNGRFAVRKVTEKCIGGDVWYANYEHRCMNTVQGKSGWMLLIV